MAYATTASRGLLALFALTVCVMLIVAVSDLFGARIQDLSLNHPGLDKLAHFSMHIVLVVALYRIQRRYWPQRGAAPSLMIAAGVAVLFGFLDEGHQYFVGGREFDLFDVAANLCGAAFAAALVALLRKASHGRLLAAAVPLALFAGVLAHAQAQTQHFNSGLLLLRGGQYAAARDALLLAVAEGHTSPSLYNELAWIELEFLDVDPAPALRYTTQAVARDPDNPDYLDTHGWALYRNRRHQEALDVLLRAYALKPDIFCIHYHLGASYHALGRDAEAVRHLRLQLTESDDGRFAAKARELLTKLQDGGTTAP